MDKHWETKINPDLENDEILSLVSSGESYFRLVMTLINRAQRSIRLQMYILDNDQTGREVMEGLVHAAARGVDVRVLLDAYGSADINSKWLKKYTDKGITIRLYGAFKFARRWQMGRRLHQKILVVDKKFSLVGGLNISNHYRGVGSKPWLDFAILVKNGIGIQLHGLCDLVYNKRYMQLSSLKSKPSVLFNGSTEVGFLRNDWLGGKAEISRSYREQVALSRESISMVASYFLPGRRLRKRMKEAAERGVNIRLVLSSISDVILVKNATNYLYGRMLKAGIRIFEYKPGVVHGKMAVIDKRWATVGSYNLNHLSDYGSVELNLKVESGEFPGHVEASFDEIVNEYCEEISEDQFLKRTVFGHFYNWLAYVIVRMSQRLLLYFTKKGRVVK